MRGSYIAIIFFLVSGFVPVVGFAQQTTTDASQASPAQTGQSQQQHADQRQAPSQTQPSGQAQNQSTKVEPAPSADQIAQQQAEERIKRAEERMIVDRIRQRLMEERENQQNSGRNSRTDDDNMNPRPGYGLAPGGARYSYEPRPYPRVKTCIEYENGDEFCRYRAN
jgi:cytoskeletal protein RodZ